MFGWYVIHSKPHNEEFLWKQLGLRNIEVYYPRVRVQTVNPRARKVQPYFPGYLFVHVDLEAIGRSTLDRIPGGTGLVAFGGDPADVPESLIHTLQQLITSPDAVMRKPPVPFKSGDHVQIRGGFFAGFEAIFDIYLTGRDRARVLLSFLHERHILVELPAACIQ